MRIGMGSTRLRNIEETEKAKLSLSHGRGRPREPQHHRKVPDEEAHLAATRCASFFGSFLSSLTMAFFFFG